MASTCLKLLFWAWLSTAMLLLCPGARGQCQEGWVPGVDQQGIVSTVYASVMWDPDGPGPLSPVLVVGNDGPILGSHFRGVATWNGTTWNDLGDGITGRVYTLAVFNGQLYAGGDFSLSGQTPLSNLARWNGSAWESVPGGDANGTVRAMTVFNGNLYIGGDFINIGGVPYHGLAKWDGSAFSPLGTGVDATVYALCGFQGRLYVGGSFFVAGGVPSPRLAAWNGSSFDPPQGIVGISGNTITAMTVWNDSLIVGGDFLVAGGITANGVASFDGSAWHALGIGTANGFSTQFQNGRPTVRWMAPTSHGLMIAAAGYINGIVPTKVSIWDGSRWSSLSGITGNDVYTLAEYDGKVFMGGQTPYRFDQAGFSAFTWDGSTLAPLANGLSPTVNALVKYNGRVYACGSMMYSGAKPVGNIAWFDGSVWQPLTGGGTSAQIRAAIVYNGKLIVGGDFLAAGENGGRYAAMWDGSTWSPMPGLDGNVWAFAILNGDLYAGGEFTSRVAKWNGATFASDTTNTIGAGVYCLTVFDGTLFAGGRFGADTAGTPLRFVAKKVGAAWVTAGTRLYRSTYAFAVHNNQLYVAGLGLFPSGSSFPDPQVARWNGTDWVSLPSANGSGPGPAGTVFSLQSFNGELYAGGTFTMVDGQPIAAAARWDGTQWSAVGNGFGIFAYSVNAMLADGNVLWLGGDLQGAAPDISSPNVIRWSAGGGSTQIITQPQSVQACAGAPAQLYLAAGGSTPPLGYQWRKNGALLTDAHGFTGSQGPTLTLAASSVADDGVYDCLVFTECGLITSSSATLEIDPACTYCDSDFNHDGVIDQGDVDALINSVAGGPCP